MDDYLAINGGNLHTQPCSILENGAKSGLAHKWHMPYNLGVHI